MGQGTNTKRFADDGAPMSAVSLTFQTNRAADDKKSGEDVKGAYW